ncbi:MAG: DUF5677 domain-containing protein [Bacilli bacterium]|nr:DUF5677 domain-containing protein [Bacilli bacterium]
MTSEAMQQISDTNVLPMTPMINPVEVIYYCIGEYVYSIGYKTAEEITALYNNEDYLAQMAGVIGDKYLSLSMFNHSERKIANRYLPPMSSLNIYLNFMANILQNYQKHDPMATLIADLLMKSVSIARSILNLLIMGYETEAFSGWRTLHECECALVVLAKYGKPVINRYLIHMQYGIVFKNADLTSEQGNKIFADMKREMQELGLKSKDIKKYIEYGWLFEIPEFKNNPEYKLNFRDGLEKIAELSTYADRYELSSETVHVTPMLIYSNKEYFYFVTLLSLYESFFRLEKVFVSLFAKWVSEDQLKQYTELRKVYYSQLVNIHKREMANFKAWNKMKNKKKEPPKDI